MKVKDRDGFFEDFQKTPHATLAREESESVVFSCNGFIRTRELVSRESISGSSF